MAIYIFRLADTESALLIFPAPAVFVTFGVLPWAKKELLMKFLPPYGVILLYPALGLLSAVLGLALPFPG